LHTSRGCWASSATEPRGGPDAEPDAGFDAPLADAEFDAPLADAEVDAPLADAEVDAPLADAAA
jgi:hypothetical protein